MDGPLAGGTYEIVIGATLGLDWADWFEGFEVEASGGTTVLRGPVADQSALHGILALLRDLALPLLDVHLVGDSDTTAPETEVGAGELPKAD
jgi:hypothetical protein